MFIIHPNENKIKTNLRFTYYSLTWKLKLFSRRIKADSFSLGIPFAFNINFKVISMSEYHMKYCRDTISRCSGAYAEFGKETFNLIKL